MLNDNINNNQLSINRITYHTRHSTMKVLPKHRTTNLKGNHFKEIGLCNN